MPRINLATRNQPQIGEMRDVVIVCTGTERPDDFVSTIVEKPGVFRCHARIRNLRQYQILGYKAVFNDENVPTTEITIRSPPDVQIDVGYWIYRLTGDAQVWYRVRNIEDLGQVRRFTVLQCSIDVLNDRRRDAATQQPPPAWMTPQLD